MRYVLLAIATVGIIVAQGAPEKRVAKQNGSAETKSADTEHPSPGVTVIVKQESAAPDRPATPQSQEDIAIQRKLARFTGWLVAVGFIQAVILGFTVWAIVRQTNANRAWISVDIDWDRKRWSDGKFHLIDSSGTSGDHTVFEAVLVCRNEGKSPAWIDEKRAKCELFTEIPATPNLRATEIVQLGPEPIGIGQAIPHTSKIPMFMAGEGRFQEGKIIIVYGVVKYRDAFGSYQTTFGYRIPPSGPVRLEGHPKYNRNT
jgi:hypothetical protein